MTWVPLRQVVYLERRNEEHGRRAKDEVTEAREGAASLRTAREAMAEELAKALRAQKMAQLDAAEACSVFFPSITQQASPSLMPMLLLYCP